LSTEVKITIYKTVLKPAAVCRSETWSVTEMGVKRLNTWERKILRTIYGPEVEQGMWRVRTNHELRELYGDLDIVADIKRSRLE
jgi:hypothetical protein